MKRSLPRLFVMLCLCCISLLLRSEDKLLIKIPCVAKAQKLPARVAAPAKRVKKIKEAGLTYYGFFSKF
jgi:hypothetical protein